ncbi:hypothetical protein OY671_007933, partial [Metschnikowia pulcherrima]
ERPAIPPWTGRWRNWASSPSTSGCSAPIPCSASAAERDGGFTRASSHRLRRHPPLPLREERATTGLVTAKVGPIAGQQGAEAGAQAGEHAWRAMRDIKDIQFAPVPPEHVVPPQPPAWSEAIARFLAESLKPRSQWSERWSGLGFGVFETVSSVSIGAGASWIAWSSSWPSWRDRRPREAAAETGWTPDSAAAIASSEEADRSAAEGRYGEAAHLSLQRSVHHIAAARPEWSTPSTTSREIGAIAASPVAAKQAFGVIAREVERSSFASRGLSAEDWSRAREAYARMNESPFRPRTVSGLVAVGAIAFVASLWFLGNGGGNANNGGGHASGRGSNGFAGSVAMSKADD